MQSNADFDCSGPIQATFQNFHQWRDLIAIGVSNMQNDLNKVGYKFVCQDKQLNFMGTMLQDDGKF